MEIIPNSITITEKPEAVRKLNVSPMQTKIEITYKTEQGNNNLFLNNLLFAIISQIESSGKTYSVNPDSSVFVCLHQHTNPNIIIILKKSRAKRRKP